MDPVNTIRALVRPTVTLGLLALVAWQVVRGVPTPEYVIAAFSTAFGFWFAARQK